MKKAIAIFIALAFALVSVIGFAASASAAPGDSVTEPKVLTNPSDVPDGAVEDEISTYLTDDKCDTTRSWVKTIPATEDVTHYEWGTEERTRTVVPGEHHEAVTHTEYHFAKFTRTRTRTYTEGIEATKGQHYSWTGGKRDKNNPPTEIPPSDNWQANTHKEPHGNVTGLHYRANSKGNASWFYYVEGKPAVAGSWSDWSDYGPWTKWSPETHTSWELTNVPLGNPALHASGGDNKTQWERQWQALFDGQTRSVTDTEAYDDPSTLSDWSEWTLRTQGERSQPVLPDETEVHDYRVTGPELKVDTKGTPETKEYYAWTNNAECEVSVIPEPPVTPEVPVVPNAPVVPAVPVVPQKITRAVVSKQPNTPVATVLPNTGVSNNAALVALAVMLLAGGSLVMRRGRI